MSKHPRIDTEVSGEHNQGMKSTKGFSIIEVIVVVVVIGIAVSAWWLWRSQSSDSHDDNGMKNQWSSMTEGPYLHRVSYATSTDLLNWQDSGVILGEHISVPDVVLKDGKLFMYFVDVTQDGIDSRLGLKTSLDNGATWSDTSYISIKNIGHKNPVDPAPMLLADGRIRLYYFDFTTFSPPEDKQKNKTDHVMYSAISSDGVNFTQEDGQRFAKQLIFDPDVIKVGNMWRMYIGGPQNQVLSATSKDGLTFTYEGVALNDGSVPNVIYDGSQYIMFTSGMTPGVNISTSSDGKTFTPTTHHFQTAGHQTSSPGVIKLGSDNYLMAFQIMDNTQSSQPTNQNMPPEGSGTMPAGHNPPDGQTGLPPGE